MILAFGKSLAISGSLIALSGCFDADAAVGNALPVGFALFGHFFVAERRQTREPGRVAEVVCGGAQQEILLLECHDVWMGAQDLAEKRRTRAVEAEQEDVRRRRRIVDRGLPQFPGLQLKAFDEIAREIGDGAQMGEARRVEAPQHLVCGRIGLERVGHAVLTV
jgi:hypothetical protein